jgi:hypothetical protein
MSNFWSDFSLTSNGHLGTKTDPFSFNDIQAHSGSHRLGNRYFCKGLYQSEVMLLELNIYANMWFGWIDSDVIETIEDENGNAGICAKFIDIWKIQNTGDILVKNELNYAVIGGGYIASNLIYPSNSHGIDLSSVLIAVNMTITTNGGIKLKGYGFYGGSSFYGNIVDDGNLGQTEIVESIFYAIVVIEGGPSTALKIINCSSQMGYSGTGTYQIIDSDLLLPVMPSVPGLLDGKLFYAHGILDKYVSKPPQKGKSLDYEGDKRYWALCGAVYYGWGLFGTPRRGIGAVYFPELISAFSGTPVEGNVQLEVEFHDETSWSESSMLSWKWDFGDGSKSYEQNPTHIYQEPGEYTVSLTVQAGEYDILLDNGEESSPLSSTTMKEKYVLVYQVDNKVQVDSCIRFATENNEGVGWSEFENIDGNNNYFARPIENGVIIIQDENDVERCVIASEIGCDTVNYEFTTFDRITNLKPQFTDLADIDGADGHEIYVEKHGREIVAGNGEDENKIKDEMSWLSIRPLDPDNRGREGYGSSGLRENQSVGMDLFVDGEKIIPSGKIEDIPENGDIVFVGTKTEARRIQYVVKLSKSEFVGVGIKHLLIKSPKCGSTVERTMVEYDYQRDFLEGLVMHITRGKFLYDLVSKKKAIGSVLRTTGPDGYAGSAIQANTPIILPDFLEKSGSFDILFMAPNVAGGIGENKPIVSFSNGSSDLFNVEEYDDVEDDNFPAITGWGVFKGTYSGIMPSGIRIISNVYPFKIFDLRIFLKSSSWATILSATRKYYNDISINKGNGFLPSFISL